MRSLSTLESVDAITYKEFRYAKVPMPEVVTYKKADADELRLHVWKPHGTDVVAPRPAVVFIHGGGWVKGSWKQFEPQAMHVAKLGMVAICVEYRTQGPVIGAEDAVDAMNYIFEHGAGLGVDVEHVVGVGGSAGGHLVLATALLDLPRPQPARRPAALVLMNPVTDTTGEFPAGFGRGWFDDAAEARRYSPYHHVAAGMPPVLIMHGTADRTVSYENSTRFAAAVVDQGGGWASVVPFEGQDHGFFNRRSDGDNKYYQETTELMADFLLRRAWATRRHDGSTSAL